MMEAHHFIWLPKMATLKFASLFFETQETAGRDYADSEEIMERSVKADE